MYRRFVLSPTRDTQRTRDAVVLQPGSARTARRRLTLSGSPSVYQAIVSRLHTGPRSDDPHVAEAEPASFAGWFCPSLVFQIRECVCAVRPVMRCKRVCQAVSHVRSKPGQRQRVCMCAIRVTLHAGTRAHTTSRACMCPMPKTGCCRRARRQESSHRMRAAFLGPQF